jgi:GDP-mannose 6-dehydrogenase
MLTLGIHYIFLRHHRAAHTYVTNYSRIQETSLAPAILAVVGVGRIGCVTAACLAHAGHTVRGIDINEDRLASLRARQLPFHEPQLLDVLQQVLDSGNLTVTSDLREGIASAGFVMPCIGTESMEGTAVVGPLLQLIDQIVQAHRDGLFDGVIVIRSTVPPGTCRNQILPRLAGTRLGLAFQPEFLREGSSIKDYLDPSLFVVGSVDPSVAARVAALHGPAAGACQYVSLDEAELIKYACNTFHALKVAFANEVGTLSERFDARGAEVMRVLALDTRLNASAAYLRPGFAFGGYCLPKDVQVLDSCARQLDLTLPVIAGILPSNGAHLDRAIAAAAALNVPSIGIFGFSFKAGTDDLRASPALHLAEALLRQGRAVHLFDPYFAPANVPSAHAPHLPATLAAAHLYTGMDSWLAAVQGVVLTQAPGTIETRSLLASNLPIVDCFGVLRASMRDADPLLPPSSATLSPATPLLAPSGPLVIAANESNESNGLETVALSIVVPTYQEAAGIGRFLDTLCASLDHTLAGNYEIIVVDDNSPDNTWQIALAAAARLPQVRVVRRQGERGLATAVIRGWQVAHGRVLGTINADFQHPPDLIVDLWKALAATVGPHENPPRVAVATRYAFGGGVGDWSLPRRIFSRSATLMARLILPVRLRGVSDPLSGCYLFQRSLIAGIELMPAGYKTLVEILIRSIPPLRLVEVPYCMAVRTTGKSKANLWRSFDFVTQLWRLRAAAKLKV